MLSGEKKSMYKLQPIDVINQIPIFSNIDEYIANYHEIATDHISQINEHSDNPWIDDKTWEQMEFSTLELAQKYIEIYYNENKSITVLDIGVGLGRLIFKIRYNIQSPNIDAYGMDIAMPYLLKAKDKGINVCLARIEDMPYKNEIFDMITCTDVLEHVLDINTCIQNILNVLKPGGILLIRVPYREDLSPYLQPEYPYEFAHLRSFDEYSLQLIFSRIFDCEILDIKPGFFMEKYSLLKYKLPLKKYNSLISKTLSFLRFVHQPSHNLFLKKIFYPLEINVVVRKK